MTKVSFRCPLARLKVECLIGEDTAGSPDQFLPVKCPACGMTHFVNPITQKLLGHEKGEQADS